MRPVVTVGLDGSPESSAAAEGAGPPAACHREHRCVPAPRPGPVVRAAVRHARRPVAVVPHD